MSSEEVRNGFVRFFCLTAAFFLLTLLYFSVRLARVEDVFCQERPTFLDSDAYTRMERVRQIEKNNWLPLRYHHFENAPDGIVSHATSPLDYAILLLSLPLRFFVGADLARDLAGVWISPFVGLIGLFVLWRVLRGVAGRWWVLAAYCAFPAIAWAQNVGRPDHQSVLVVLLAWVLIAEWLMLSGRRSRRWELFSGVSWGLALWVSLWEPLVLCVVIFFVQLALKQGSWLARGRDFFVPLIGLVCLRFVADPWPVVPDRADFVYLQNWGKLVGELRGSSFKEMVYWTGLWVPVIIIACIFFICKREYSNNFIFSLVLTLLPTALTFWQIRWSPYLATVLATVGMAGFFQTGQSLKKIFVAVISTIMIPLYYAQSALQWRQPLEGIAETHRVGEIISQEPGTILAPWWISPMLGYLSGAGYVASSSHQSISGIIDVSEFFLTPHWDVAREILIDRKVKWIVAAEPERMFAQSLAVVRGLYVPADEKVLMQDISYRVAMGTRLARGVLPDSGELFLKAVVGPYRVYRFLPRTDGAMP
jgi:hypothetical protein